MRTGPLFVASLVLITTLPALGQEDLLAGTYSIDPSHTSVTFSVNHIGLTDYTASFDEIDATLDIDPTSPEAARLSATIQVSSLDLPKPPEGFLDTMLGPDWFNAAAFPAITFESVSVTLLGENKARIDGHLTLLGVAVPLALDARFNGGYGQNAFEPNGRLGFSADADFNRSDFGMSIGIPPEGSMLGVGDKVSVRIESEFVIPLEPSAN